MTDRSLTGSSLGFVFCLSGYIAYVNAILTQNTTMVIISALIYFLPLFIDFLEDFQNTRVGDHTMFVTLVGCFVAGVVYAVTLFSYLAIFDGDFSAPLPIFMCFLVTLLPIACLPIKAYPMFVKIMQMSNRNAGKAKHHHHR